MSGGEYVESELISLNSKFGTLKNGTMKSNVLFNTRGLLRNEYNVSRVEVVLCNIQIPISFLMINKTNDYLAYTIGTTPVQKSITLTHGNYDGYGLIVELTNQFANNNDYFNIASSYLNGVFTFSASTTFTFQYATSTCFYLLGLGNSDITDTNNTLIAPFPFNLLSVNQIVIQSSTLSTTGYNSANSGYNSILATITNNQTPYSLLVMENQAKLSIKVRNREIDQIDILLLDQNGAFIDFLNQDWCITLALNVYRLNVPIKPRGIYDAIHHKLKNPPPPLEDLAQFEPVDMELELLQA